MSARDVLQRASTVEWAYSDLKKKAITVFKFWVGDSQQLKMFLEELIRGRLNLNTQIKNKEIP
jgi:hypothetical protein